MPRGTLTVPKVRVTEGKLRPKGYLSRYLQNPQWDNQVIYGALGALCTFVIWMLHGKF